MLLFLPPCRRCVRHRPSLLRRRPAGSRQRHRCVGIEHLRPSVSDPVYSDFSIGLLSGPMISVHGCSLAGALLAPATPSNAMGFLPLFSHPV